ncbi:hypothetical protein MMC17_000335 [Xylographa soralifera]|nr:hypothetical protein [Xylographa soralifera]
MGMITCQGQSINCTSFIGGYNDLAGEIDPDVAGYGVIVAFIFTGIATLVVLYAGYITDSLDNAQLNAIDLKARNILRSLLFLKPLPQEQDSNIQKAKEVRSEALSRFILTFSDQQLVTGLAVLIASFAKQCTITGYNFQITTALAWFSSVTHLATLSVLRRYFLDRPRILYIRLIGMIAVLGFLLSAELIPAVVSWALFQTLPCAIDLNANNFSSFSPLVSNSISGAWLFLYLGIAYGNRIISLICDDPQLTALEWILQKSRKVLGVSDTASYQERAKKTLLSIHRPTRRSLYTRTRDLFSMMGFFFNELLSSFLWQLMFTTFGVTYGLLEVVVDRWPQKFGSDWKSTTDQADNFGFGQLVPLLLLFLPVLSAIEVYEDVRVLTAKTLAHSTSASSSGSVSRTDHQPITAPSPTTQAPGLAPAASVSATSSALREPSGSEAVAETNDIEEPQQATLPRKRGIERSIGIELEHIKRLQSRSPATSKSHGASNPSTVLTQKDLNEIYSFRYAKSTIAIFVLLSSIALVVFALALVGLPLFTLTVESAWPLPFKLSVALTVLWALWYYWDIFDLMYSVQRKWWASLKEKTHKHTRRT